MTFSPRKLVTLGVLSGLVLSAIEISVVGTAAPRIARDIGGLDSYSWIFTVYLLTSTVSMPAWGRLSDQIGRKVLFEAALGIFLVGSVMCGFSRDMPELIVSRGIKGIGAGGLFPLAFTIIADLFPYRERGRVQGALSSVWGISSLIGPFIGGTLTDHLGWRAIFFVNLIPGAASLVLIRRFFRDSHIARRDLPVPLTSLASSSVFAALLILAMRSLQRALYRETALLAVAAAAAFFWFLRCEKKAVGPLLPRTLRSNRVFAASCLTGFFVSMMIIGLSSFGPLLFQSVLGYSPTASGLLLVPFTLAWVVGSVVSTRLLLKHHYRNLLLFGGFATGLGLSAFLAGFSHLSTLSIALTTVVMGWGMSFNYPIALITMQNSVPAGQVGFATSALAWIRNLGTTLGTGAMGVTLSLAHETYRSAGLGEIQSLKRALFGVFALKFAAVWLAFALSFLFPRDAGLRADPV